MNTLLQKIAVTILISLFLSELPKAQNPNTPIHWGKVSQEELALKECVFEKNAGAVILCDFGELSAFTDEPVKLKRHKRIKILTEDGTSAADVKIPFYTKNNFEMVLDLQAQTIQADESGNLTFTAVEKNQIFRNNIDKSWSEIIFTFPNAKVGAILEMEYTFISQDFYHLTPWYFQAEIPTLHSELTIDVASTRTYNAVVYGTKLQMEAANNKNAGRWILKDVPSLQDEPFVWNYNDYAENIEFQLSSQSSLVLTSTQIAFKDVTIDWDMLSKNFLKNEEIEKYISKHQVAEKIVEKLNLKGKPNEEKIKTLFHYVNQNFQWNNEIRLFPEQTLKELLDSKQGNSAELNLLLILLLREFGIPTYPALISTKDRGKPSRDIVSMRQFNNLVCIVKLKDKSLLMDARADYHPYFLPEKLDLNEDVFVLDEFKAHWMKINPPLTSSRTVYINLDMTENGSEEKSGDISLRLDGYHAVAMREEIAQKGQEDFIKERQYSEQIKLLHTSIDHLDNLYESLVIKSDFKDLNEWQDSLLYFNPFYVNFYEENLLKADKRFFPVDFTFPDKDYFVVRITLPTDYQVIEIPKDLQIKLPNGGGTYVYSVTQQENILQITSRVILNKALYLVDEYPYLKEFFDQIREKHAEQIVLKKKN
ncbi:MAG: DUF3857 domain-containing protein [Microscillaceae bacterium]|nr:DUF3857 domain-containing protein [Microscillaceae bacterium]